MSLPKDVPIRVMALNYDGSLKLRAFSCGGRWYRVTRVLEEWFDTGEWWKGESEKRFYRVEAALSLFEVYYEPQSKTWRLYKVYD
ncbi:MAG TPA: hypothetical protein GXX40_09970 [Firmicutes bacterium]|nr:hypothetical protein [Bacillota bacterium]